MTSLIMPIANPELRREKRKKGKEKKGRGNRKAGD
jgi:hypothetical protein